MADESIYGSLAKLTEEMYLSLEKGQKSQMQDQVIEYHSMVEKKIVNMLDEIEVCKAGEIVTKYKNRMRIMHR